MSSKVARLQAAVREMLAEINSYEEHENTMRVRPHNLSTLAHYDLTEEDMKP